MKTSLDDHKFVLRLPDDLRTRLVDRANRDHSSMNSVILRALEQYLVGDSELRQELKALVSQILRQIN